VQVCRAATGKDTVITLTSASKMLTVKFPIVIDLRDSFAGRRSHMEFEGFVHVLVFPLIYCTGYENHVGDGTNLESNPVR
jgi:hypothetical protein